MTEFFDLSTGRTVSDPFNKRETQGAQSMTLREFLERNNTGTDNCHCGEVLYFLPHMHFGFDGDGNRHLPPEQSEYDRGWNDAMRHVHKEVASCGLKEWCEKQMRKPSCRKEPI